MIRRHLSSARQSWHSWLDSDHSLAALLFFLVLYSFIVYPLTGEEARTHPATTVSFSVILILGVMSTTKDKVARLLMTSLAAVAFTSQWLHFFLKVHPAHVVATVAAILFFAVLSWRITARVFRGGSINIYRILGAIAVYVLLGIVWGEIYILIYLQQPSSFYFNANTQMGEPPISELIYFSFVSLTTIGFGDILPVHPLARSLVTLEGLVGQIYPAVLLARLVTLYNK
jgi:hypothetical protein